MHPYECVCTQLSSKLTYYKNYTGQASMAVYQQATYFTCCLMIKLMYTHHITAFIISPQSNTIMYVTAYTMHSPSKQYYYVTITSRHHPPCIRPQNNTIMLPLHHDIIHRSFSLKTIPLCYHYITTSSTVHSPSEHTTEARS